MAIYRAQRVYATLIDGSGRSISDFKSEWLSGGGKDKLGSFKDWYKGQNTGLAAANTQKANEMAIRQETKTLNAANNSEFAKMGKAGNKTGIEALKNQNVTKGAFNAGANSVGIKQGALNTWNNMGKMGKAGVIGAGIVGTGLMAKGLFGGGGSKETAFSDDTERSLREAKLIGGGLALTTGGVLLAKHGGLGLTKAQRAGNKEAYNKVVKKVKSVWAETKKEPGKKPEAKVTTRETVETPKKEIRKETRKETGKKPESEEVTVVKEPRKRYSEEDFKRIRESLMKKGIKHPKAPDIEKEASVLGIK